MRDCSSQSPSCCDISHHCNSVISGWGWIFIISWRKTLLLNERKYMDKERQFVGVLKPQSSVSLLPNFLFHDWYSLYLNPKMYCKGRMNYSLTGQKFIKTVFEKLTSFSSTHFTPSSFHTCGVVFAVQLSCHWQIHTVVKEMNEVLAGIISY